MIFVLGLVIAIACGNTMKNSSELLTRKKGVWMCIIGVLIVLITGYIPFINGDIGGGFGAIVFLLGLILIAIRWKH